MSSAPNFPTYSEASRREKVKRNLGSSTFLGRLRRARSLHRGLFGACTVCPLFARNEALIKPGAGGVPSGRTRALQVRRTCTAARPHQRQDRRDAPSPPSLRFRLLEYNGGTVIWRVARTRHGGGVSHKVKTPLGNSCGSATAPQFDGSDWRVYLSALGAHRWASALRVVSQP